MAQKVNIKGVGVVEFPDDMTRDQIKAAIDARMAKQNSEAVAQAPGAVGQAVSGLAQTLGTIENTPEVRTRAAEIAKTPQEMQQAAVGLVTGDIGIGTSDRQLQDIVAKKYPGAEFRDEAGGVIATIDGKDYWLNKPGFSGQDADNVRVNMAASAPFVPLGLGGGGMLARFIGGGLAAGGTEAAMDVAASADGSEQGVDPLRAGLAFGAGGALDAILPRIIGPIGRWIRSGRQAVVNGAPSPEIQKLLKINGIDPASIPPQTWEKFARIVRSQGSDDLMAAFRMADAQSLPNPPNLNLAQATADPNMARTAGLAEAGSMGPGAAGIMKDARNAQGEAMQASAGALQQQIGGAQITGPGQGAAIAANDLALKAARDKAGVNTAYDLARSIGKDAATPEGAFKTWGKAVRQILDERGFDLDMMPAASKYLGDIEGMGDTLPALMKWRARVTNAIRDAATPSERAALSLTLDGFDDWLDDAATKGVMSGDPAAVDAWRDAISKNRAMREAFERKSITDKLVDLNASGGPALRVEPDDAVKLIFGSSGLGNKTNLARDMAKLRDVLGADSAGWKALKEEAFLDLFRGQPGAEGAGAFASKKFSPAQFNKQLTQALQKKPEAMRLLFTPEEIKQLQQFGRVAESLYGKVPLPQNVNPSGTELLRRNLTRRSLMGMNFLTDKAVTLLGAVMPGISDLAGSWTASRMIKGVLPKTVPTMTAAPAGAVIAD